MDRCCDLSTVSHPLPFIHTHSDALVKGATGLTVAQIFEQDGEEGFRDVEAAVLNEVASYARVVVSTGGGVVARPQNWGHLRNGIVVYLQAPVGCVVMAGPFVVHSI